MFSRGWIRLACCLLILFPCLAFSGQSLVLNRAVSIPVTDPILGQKQSWRVEFQFHNWTLPPAGFYGAVVFNLSGTGTKATISPDGRLAIEASDQVSAREPCFLSTEGIGNALVRIQRNAETMQFSCEMWNYDGTGYRNEVMQLTVLQSRTTAGGNIGGGATGALAFLRVSTKLLPLGGRPPNALLEAMATSVPVVATAVGGVPEIVTDEESALLVKPGDAAAMSAAIARVLNEPKLAARLTQRGHELILARHTPEARVRRLVEIYRGLSHSS